MYTDKLTMGFNGIESNMQVNGLGITIPQITLPTTTPKPGFFQPGGGLDKVLNTATKVGTAYQQVKSNVTSPARTNSITPAQYGAQAPVQNTGPNYLKIGLIVAGVAVAGYAGYKLMKSK